MDTVNLRVVADYRSGVLFYAAGTEIVVTYDLATWLQNDAPGCFEAVVEQPAVKDIEQPPADKMLKRAPRRK